MSDQNYFLNTDIIGDFNDSTIDNSGYGSLSAAEKNQTYFAYFTSVGGTGPEIIDQTAYFIKYLIDAKGNVVAPQPNSIDILNLTSNFETNKLVNVTNLEGTSLFNSLLGTKVITDVGRIETISISQTGSGIKDYTSSLTFNNSQALYNYGGYNYNFYAFNSSDNQTISDSYTVVKFNGIPSNLNNRYTGSTSYNYTFENNTSANYNPVAFKAQIQCSTAQAQVGGGNYGWIPTDIYVRIVTSSAATPTVFDYVLKEQVYNITQQVNSLYIDTPFTNFSAGSRVRVEIKRGSIPYGASSPLTYQDYIMYFSLTPSYSPSIEAISPFFTTGSANDICITASATLGNAYSFNMTQVNPTDNTLNFDTIAKTFKPQSGDYIRFEYNPLKTYRIYEIITTGSNGLVFRLNNPVIDGTNINNFVIYRVNPNAGNQIILNVKKPTGTTGQPLTGFLKPQHMSKELEDNFTTIIQKLAAEGTI
jgi:hypothetical protein